MVLQLYVVSHRDYTIQENVVDIEKQNQKTIAKQAIDTMGTPNSSFNFRRRNKKTELNTCSTRRGHGEFMV